jgi:formate/nitrite transporter FocA (FNT family)
LTGFIAAASGNGCGGFALVFGTVYWALLTRDRFRCTIGPAE